MCVWCCVRAMTVPHQVRKPCQYTWVLGGPGGSVKLCTVPVAVREADEAIVVQARARSTDLEQWFRQLDATSAVFLEMADACTPATVGPTHQHKTLTIRQGGPQVDTLSGLWHRLHHDTLLRWCKWSEQLHGCTHKVMRFVLHSTLHAPSLPSKYSSL